MKFKVITPRTTSELLDSIAKLQGAPFRFGAGYTDLLPELQKQPIENLTVINLAYLEDAKLKSIEALENGLAIGAAVTARMLLDNQQVQQNYPVLYDAADQLASRQIRQVATVGGNLCTASPAGDLGCALVALQADCELLSAKGTLRTIPLRYFFKGVRKTDLQGDELLYRLIVPSNQADHEIRSGFIKVGTRKSMEIAVVSLAYHLELKEDKIDKAGAAIGSVAPVIEFVDAACDFLLGKSFSDIDEKSATKFADKVVSYASPISDIRASDWYRTEVLRNISRSIFENSGEKT